MTDTGLPRRALVEPSVDLCPMCGCASIRSTVNVDRPPHAFVDDRLVMEGDVLRVCRRPSCGYEWTESGTRA